MRIYGKIRRGRRACYLGTNPETGRRIASGLAAVLLCVLLAGNLLSCSSVPELDEESPSLYFKAAEMARFQRKRREAIEIYKLVQLRFGEHYNIVLEAEFSIAQIYYGWRGHDAQAQKHYQNVVAFYQRPEIGTDIFPLSYLNLAQANLQTIKNREKFAFLPPKTDGVRTVIRKKSSKAKKDKNEAQSSAAEETTSEG